jgi:hypothetical protein
VSQAAYWPVSPSVVAAFTQSLSFRQSPLGASMQAPLRSQT